MATDLEKALGIAIPSLKKGLSSAVSRGHTLVVAASNATSRFKEIADYICDGVDDHDDIRTAIDLIGLSGLGGTVILSEGTFNFGGQLRFNAVSNINLIGQGQGTTILKKTVDDNLPAGTRAININPGDNIRIAHLTVDGNRTLLTGASNNDCILVTGGSDNVLLEDLEIKDFRHSGIRIINGGSRVTIRNCYIHSSTTETISRGIEFDGSTSPTIEGLVEGCRIETTAQFGLRAVNNSHNCIFRGNIVKGPTQIETIHIVLSDGVIVDNNYVFQSGDAGITFDRCNDGICSNNVVEESDNDGILLADVTNCIVIGNVSKNNGQVLADAAGIAFIQFTASPCTEFIITGNRCYDDQGVKTQDRGIRSTAHAHNNYIITNNILLGNDTSSLNDLSTGPPTNVVANNIT